MATLNTANGSATALRASHDRRDDVLDVHIGLALPPVAEDAQAGRVGEKPADEVESDSVRLARSDDVAEAVAPGRDIEHGRVGAEQRLPGQFAGAVRGDGKHRAVVLARLDLAEVAVDPAARGVEDELDAAPSSRLGHVVGEQRALVEVDGRVGRRGRDVRVGRQVDHGVVSCHSRQQVLEVADFADLDPQPWVVGDVGEVPAAPRGEVVVDRDLLGSAAQQVLHEMTADEACATDEPRSGAAPRSLERLPAGRYSWPAPGG